LLQHQSFDAAHSSPQVLCELSDGSGRAYRVALPQYWFDLLTLFDGHKNNEAILAEFNHTHAEHCIPEQLQAFITDFALPKKILVAKDSSGVLSERLIGCPSYMLFKQALLKPAWVNAITKGLTRLFNPMIAIVIVLTCVLTHIAFFNTYSAGVVATVLQPDALAILLGFGVFVGVLLLHELGHAAAAYYYGCKQVEIGFGWYLFFGVFYAELSEIWRLTRKQRAVVDGGGMYFQVMAVSILMLIHYHTQSAVVYYAILLAEISLLVNLNPFFRMDGYWLASDWMGIPNLRSAAQQSVQGILRKESAKQTNTSTDQHLPRRKQQQLFVYAVLSNVFFLCIAYWIVRYLLWEVIAAIPVQYTQLQQAIQENEGAAELIVYGSGLLWKLLLFFFLVSFLA